MTLSDGYFDWAATALPDSEILKEALEISIKYSGNPSSAHKAGISAKEILTDARKRCAKVLNVKPETIIFTSGGTESDCIPIVSLLQRPSKGSIVISGIEHPAVREQALMLKNCGWQVFVAMPDKNGIVTPEAVIEQLKDDTALVCVMAVNNETGAIQPIAEISKAITEATKGHKRPKFHVDAVQALGKTPIDFSIPGIDSGAISAHKIRGARGIGILYMAGRQEPFLRGGGQENGIRSGTENLFGILSLTMCLEKYATAEIVEKNLCMQKNRTKKFIEKLNAIKGCTIVPVTRQADDERFSPWVLQVAFKNVPGEVMVRALSEKGFYISTGSACSAKKQSRPILEAMHILKDIASTAVRFSFGIENSERSYDDLVEAVKSIVNIMN